MKWTLKARGFGTNGQFVDVVAVEAETHDQAQDLVRAGRHQHMLAFARRDWKLEPEDRRVLLIAYWKPRQSGGHRARGHWTRHQQFPGEAFGLCGDIPSPYVGTQMAHQCGDGDWLQGEKARCQRCDEKAAAMAPTTEETR